MKRHLLLMIAVIAVAAELGQPLLDEDDLSEQLKIPKGTFRQWRYLGKGPTFVRVGRHVRYRQEDVDAWLDTQAATPAPAAS